MKRKRIMSRQKVYSSKHGRMISFDPEEMTVTIAIKKQEEKSKDVPKIVANMY